MELSHPMATKILLELQRVLSKPDFETVKVFISLCNDCSPEALDQTTICFDLFVENLEKRYNKNFVDCRKVLAVRLEDVEHELCTAENQGLRSPKSEKRRNTGKHYRSCKDNDYRETFDDFESEKRGWTGKGRQTLGWRPNDCRNTERERKTCSVFGWQKHQFSAEGSWRRVMKAGSKLSVPIDPRVLLKKRQFGRWRNKCTSEVGLDWLHHSIWKSLAQICELTKLADDG